MQDRFGELLEGHHARAEAAAKGPVEQPPTDFGRRPPRGANQSAAAGGRPASVGRYRFNSRSVLPHRAGPQRMVTEADISGELTRGDGGCLFDDLDFLVGQAVQFIDQDVDLPVGGGDLPLHDRFLVRRSHRGHLLVQV